MNISTQIFYSDMTSDEDSGGGEMSLNTNIYVQAQGASPSEKVKIKEILDRHYSEIRSEIRTIGRFV
jgi:hypothetical protein